MDDQFKVAFFISIGVIVGFLPLLFVKREETSLKFLLLLASVCVGISLAVSTVLSMIGGCSFFDALSMKSELCRHLPFGSTRIVFVMKVMAFSILLLLPVAVIRDLVFWLRARGSREQL